MKIAIIGGGISGMVAGYLLRGAHDITLYEKEARMGGHSRTIDVKTPDGIIAVDTGFIVFNHRNYPFLRELFARLDVPTAKSNMSFGVSIDGGWLEYGTQNMTKLFCQHRNMCRPSFLRMVADILRFNKHARAYVEAHPRASMRQCLHEMGMGAWFRDYYILAMGAAIWSTPLKQMLDFPARSMVRFFDNHGLLQTHGQPQWYTVRGGSREYVARLTASFKDRILLSCGAVAVLRRGRDVEVRDAQGGARLYDAVIFACHSDQALALIENPHADERRVLGAVKYQANHAVLHGDRSFMPVRRGAWASWVYLHQGARAGAQVKTTAETAKINAKINISYWMNNLQPLNTPHPIHHPIIVTLNPSRPPAHIYDEHIFTHPVFDRAAIEAQAELASIQGRDRLWFCGAWCGYGFHEDGAQSACQVAEQLGVKMDAQIKG